MTKEKTSPMKNGKWNSFKTMVKKSYVGWLFTLPLVLGLLIFTFYPMLMSFVYSLSDFNGVEQFNFIGLKNYIKIFTVDKEFWPVLGNTFLYALITVPLSLVLSYLLALMLNRDLKGIGVFRVLYYLPVVIPGVVSGLLWKNVFDPTYGLANSLLNSMGLPSSQFLESSSTAMLTIIFMSLWGLGGNMVLWLSALKNIPPELYEAAMLDGASPFRKLISITIPLSTSMIFYNLITGVIGSLQTFSTYIIANNNGKGPDNSLYFLAVKIYNTAFAGTKLQYGYASALSWVLFVIVGLLTITVFRTSKWVYYGEES